MNELEYYRAKQMLKDINLLLPNDALDEKEFVDILKFYITVEDEE